MLELGCFGVLRVIWFLFGFWELLLWLVIGLA